MHQQLQLSQQTSYNAELQLSHCHRQLFYKPSFAKALENDGICCKRKGKSKPNGKCSIARYGKNEQTVAWIILDHTDVSLNITAVRWKQNKVVNVISAFADKQPIQQVKHYCYLDRRSVNIEQPNITNQYNVPMGGVYRIDQTISVYIINLRTKKWWCSLFFDLLLMWPSLMLTKYIINPN